ATQPGNSPSGSSFQCSKDQQSGVRPAWKRSSLRKWPRRRRKAGSEPQVSHEIDATIHSHPDGPPARLVGEEMVTPLRGGTTSSNPCTLQSGYWLVGIV